MTQWSKVCDLSIWIIAKSKLKESFQRAFYRMWGREFEELYLERTLFGTVVSILATN